MTITTGQEMKLTVQSIDPYVNSKSKTIRYVDPLAANAEEKKLTAFTRELLKNSQNTYKATKGTIDLGYLDEE